MSFVISETFKKADKTYLIILNDKEEAAYLLNDLEQLLGNKNVLFYPGSYRRPYQIDETDNANVLLRSEVLSAFLKVSAITKDNDDPTIFVI